MDDRPPNLREMLASAKDKSELMVDLAYAALFFDDPEMAAEVADLEEEMSDLVHDMRGVCVMAVRHPRDSDGMSSVLQVISAIERIANDAVDIARIVTHKMGIPAELVADLSAASEVSHRVLVAQGSPLSDSALREHELPTKAGMRVMAVRRKDWTTEVGGNTIIKQGDVLFLRGSPDGIAAVRELAGAQAWQLKESPEDHFVTDLDRAVDVLVEMKNLSEVAVGLAYSALVLGDLGLAAEVRQIEDRLDEMKDRLELWVLRAASEKVDPSGLRGLLHLSQAAEDIGDQAQAMVWLVEQQEDVHPILGLALGDSEEVVFKVGVRAASEADGRRLGDLRLNLESGFTVLAIRRGEQYLYRPRGYTHLAANDELIVSGPDEGRELLARRCGWRLADQKGDGEMELEPITTLSAR